MISCAVCCGMHDVRWVLFSLCFVCGGTAAYRSVHPKLSIYIIYFEVYTYRMLRTSCHLLLFFVRIYIRSTYILCMYAIQLERGQPTLLHVSVTKMNTHTSIYFSMPFGIDTNMYSSAHVPFPPFSPTTGSPVALYAEYYGVLLFF